MSMVRIWALEGCLASGVTAPSDIFMVANSLALDEGRASRRQGLAWRIESIDGKPIRTASGQLLPAQGAMTEDVAATAIWIATGFRHVPIHSVANQPIVSRMLQILRRHHQRGGTVATFCTGAFFLAEAGLLNGRVATTHWAAARQLQQRFPALEVRAAEVVVEQDNIITGGGVTSYNDVALRLVSKLLEPQIAEHTARMMLIDLRKAANDRWLKFAPADASHGDIVVARAQRWMESRLSEPFDAKQLSAALGVSSRTLTRRFRAVLGEPPFRHLQRLRIEVAKHLLESSAQSIEAVSERVGYADVGFFRQLFRRMTGVSPRQFKDKVIPGAVD